MNLSQNPNITIDDIKQNPDKPWDWRNISRNPNITMQFIEENEDKQWYWSAISWNKFEQHPIIKKRMFPKLPIITEEQQQLLDELHHFFLSPPDNSSKHTIFRKGGTSYLEAQHSFHRFIGS
jgi:hypothetical protein